MMICFFMMIIIILLTILLFIIIIIILIMMIYIIMIITEPTATVSFSKTRTAHQGIVVAPGAFCSEQKNMEEEDNLDKTTTQHQYYNYSADTSQALLTLQPVSSLVVSLGRAVGVVWDTLLSIGLWLSTWGCSG